MDTSLLIDNKDVPARDGKTFERRDPMTGELVTRAAAAGVVDAKAAADAAAAAFPGWARVLPSERRRLLLKAACGKPHLSSRRSRARPIHRRPPTVFP
jgi:vanillin dehydrogenase